MWTTTKHMDHLKHEWPQKFGWNCALINTDHLGVNGHKKYGPLRCEWPQKFGWNCTVSNTHHWPLCRWPLVTLVLCDTSVIIMFLKLSDRSSGQQPDWQHNPVALSLVIELWLATDRSKFTFTASQICYKFSGTSPLILYHISMYQ